MFFFFFYAETANFRTWKPHSTGLFSSRSFYRAIDPFNAVSSPCAAVWTGLVPPRIEAFCWLAVAGKVSTTDVLRRRGWCRIPLQIFVVYVGERWRQ